MALGTTPVYGWFIVSNAIQAAPLGSCVTLSPGANFITDTTKTCLTVPSDWNSSDNEIELIGGGASGGNL